MKGVVYSQVDQEYLQGYALSGWPLLAPRGCDLGGLVHPFWDPQGPFLHLGAPWENQQGHEVVLNRIFIHFDLIVGFGGCILKAFWAPMLDISIGFLAGFQVTFCIGS